MRLKWLGIVIAGLFVLAAVRTIYASSSPAALDARAAAALLRCLPPIEIAQGTPVTLAQAPVPAQGAVDLRPAAALLYEPAKDVPALADGRASAAVRDGTFTLERGAVEIRRQGFVPAILRTDRALRFQPAPQSAHDVRRDDDGFVLALGEAGTEAARPAPVRHGYALQPSQPILVQPWLDGAQPNVTPTRVWGGEGATRLQVSLNQPGIALEADGGSIRGCIARRARQGQPTDWHPIRAAGLLDGGSGAVTIALALPQAVLPVLKEMVAEIDVVLASADGRYVGFGGFTAFNAAASGIVAGAVTCVLFGMLTWLKFVSPESAGWRRRFAGLFIGPENEPSLSLLQIFLWTVITVWGLIYVFLSAGTLLAITPTMLGLLGIASAGTIAARLIGANVPTLPGTTPGPADPPDFSKLISTNGRFDLLKLQLLVFTVVIAAYVVARIAAAGAFPDLDANTLLLLGGSQGIYLGGKIAASTPQARADALLVDIEVLQRDRARLAVQRADLPGDETGAKEAAILDQRIQRHDTAIQQLTAQRDELLKQVKTGAAARTV